MKKVLIALLSGSMLLSGSAFAAKKAPAKKPAKAKVSLVCPVMGTKVASAKASAGKSTYKGVTYHFCCAGCKPEFDKNPAKYIKASNKKQDVKAQAKPAKPKPATQAAVNLVCPVMGSKVASVKAAAGSSTYKGKTYYFCCGGCKPAFDKDPEKFLSKASGDEHGAH